MKLNYFKDFKIIFFFILWVSIWLSIGINPQVIELFFIDLNKKNITIDDSLIKFLRIFTSLFLSIFLLLIFLKKIQNNKKFFYYNFSITLINIFILTQLVSLLISDNNNINIYWIYQSLVSLILIYLITKDNFSYSKILINLTILILMIVLLRYSIPFFLAFFSTHLSFYNMWPIIYDYDFSVPRPTGLARTSLILISFFLVLKFNNKKLSIIKNAIIVFCSLNIVLLQSRTIFFLWPLIVILYLFYCKNNISEKFKKFIIYIILPLFLFLSLNYTKHLISNIEYIKNNNPIFSIVDLFLSNENEIKNGNDNNKNKIQLFRDTDPKSFSSFRTLHWKKIFEDSKENFMGHGPMGDRYITKTSASSLFFYSLSSSGYIGVILILLLSLRAAYLVIYFIFIKRIIYNNHDIYLIFSCFVLIILFLRGFLETSLGIFSIDYLLFIIASLICEINFSKYKRKDKFLKK